MYVQVYLLCLCMHITCACTGRKSLDEGAGDKKAKPAKQGSQDSNGGSGDERKDSSSDNTEATSSEDASKNKVRTLS